MRRVHAEHMAYGTDHEFVLVCEVQAVQAINELGTIRHGDFFRMTIECVQRHSAEHRIAQRRHLFQLISRRRCAPGPIPWSPFVDHEFAVVLRFSFAHYLPVTFDQASIRSPSCISSYQSTASNWRAS